MQSYMEHVPGTYQEQLGQAIDLVTETKILLAQVETRFGTKEPEQLRGKMGQVFDGVEVTETSLVELEQLLGLHEERRAACQRIMDAAAKNEPLDEGDGHA